MERIPISKEGFDKISQELADLKAQRPAIIKAIAEAREEGDLSENAGYDAARERQGMLEARINYINSRMPLFDVLDLNTLNGERAIFGSTVEIEDIETEEVRKFTLLGPDDADHKRGSISVLSPMGQALLGKEEGDEIVVDAPRGKIEYEILSVNFLGSEGLKIK
ncbi:MAG: transcription elongation factor GreA [Desulfovibrionaceae bacterium]|nr:transcription elongation factor GreA [Desulfovibrionaceae bacterium]